MRILFADDHGLLRDALKKQLEGLSSEIEVRGASSFDEAMALIDDSFLPNLLLLDLNMPGMDGFKGIERAVTSWPKIPVVVVSGHIDRRTILAVIEAGARGFIPKTVTGNNLLNALRLVLAGETYLPSSLFEGDINTILARTSRKQRARGKVFEVLTKSEIDILDLLIQGKTSKDIAVAFNLTEMMVNSRARGLYKKLRAANKVEAVRIALENGWQEQ